MRGYCTSSVYEGGSRIKKNPWRALQCTPPHRENTLKRVPKHVKVPTFLEEIEQRGPRIKKIRGTKNSIKIAHKDRLL